jgi:hypothetical protein
MLWPNLCSCAGVEHVRKSIESLEVKYSAVESRPRGGRWAAPARRTESPQLPPTSLAAPGHSSQGVYALLFRRVLSPYI